MQYRSANNDVLLLFTWIAVNLRPFEATHSRAFLVPQNATVVDFNELITF